MDGLGPRLVTQTLRSWALRATRAKPGDCLIALSAASASIPLIGRHLELVGGFTALGVGGHQYLPGILAGLRRERTDSVPEVERTTTAAVLTEALHGIVDATALSQPWPSHRAQAPVLRAIAQRRYVFRSSVRYGERPSQVLDVWRLPDLPSTPAPVMIFIPGGAWVFGRRELQGHALMAHLVRRGWICLSVQYRVSPHHAWPAQIVDVKTAIAWARAHVDDFGGDRSFVAIAGCSAGGHLATLAGLTAGDPQWQAELSDDADVTVDAVATVYGIYDWNDRSTPERAQFMTFLERAVVKRRQARHPDLYRAASPVDRVHQDAPPLLAIHGTEDRLIPVREARTFVSRLRTVSNSAVGYIELAGVGHGFDLLDGTRTAPVVSAIGRFLRHVEQSRSAAV